ncbi:hypothetical protein GCM10022261_29710 [Brevibacterium daeguense]|uniref:Tryptophan-associated transmembrane protein (Trp_oprn_chp) n=1 Tax=Brevibacterium daeguense TaxID=909936 RepID=A0ABP8EN74_9MICO|nr:Trp biosynthesis-associated membrane protein [Brevibacterium daeguense]
MTKARFIFSLLLAAGVLWIIGNQPWASAAGDPTATVPGVAETAAEAPAGSPLLVACAAVVAVCALLLALLGRGGRWVVSVVAALAALGYAANGIVVLLSDRESSHWPLIGLLAGLLTAALAAWTAVASGTWTTSSRFDRDAADEGESDDALDPTQAWDRLSRGEDIG